MSNELTKKSTDDNTLTMDNWNRWEYIKDKEADSKSGFITNSIELMEAYALQWRTDTAVLKEFQEFTDQLSKRHGISKEVYTLLKDSAKAANHQEIDIKG